MKRLACLVLDPPIDYKSHYDHDIEPDLTMAEKIYFNLNIQGMSKDQLIEQFKVPTHVVRETMFYDSIYNLLYYNVNGGEDQPEEIVSMFDAYREEIKRGDLHKIVDLVIKCIKDNDRFSMAKLDWAFKSLLKLDFTDLVVGLKPAEIKDFVRAKKIETVVEAMNAIQFQKCSHCSGSGHVRV